MRVGRNDLDKMLVEINGWLDDAATIIGVEAVEEVRDHFADQGVNGQQWKPRIPGTPRNNRKILSDTNNLEDSVTYEVQAGNRRVVVGVDEDKVPYARIHQEGGEIPMTPKRRAFFWAKYAETGNAFWKRLALAKGPFIVPARPYMVATDRMLARIEAALIDHLKRRFPR